MEECLNRIRGASEFLMGLLNDLVDMSKIENGKFHLHPKPYSFTEFLNEVENMMEPMCERKWIRFHMPHEEININMMVDPVRFFQIFFNLLSNAVKFTPRAGRSHSASVIMPRTTINFVPTMWCPTTEWE